MNGELSENLGSMNDVYIVVVGHGVSVLMRVFVVNRASRRMM